MPRGPWSASSRRCSTTATASEWNLGPPPQPGQRAVRVQQRTPQRLGRRHPPGSPSPIARAVESHVNRKMIRRQMYERVRLDLLRKRILLAN
jgi:hypothetical protein